MPANYFLLRQIEQELSYRKQIARQLRRQCAEGIYRPKYYTDVITAISRLPDKSSAADPLPVTVMKVDAAELAPFLTELFNRSMSAGHFPATFKEAFITPAIKKPGLDAMDAQSYRPISNLTVVSKLLERIVAQQLKSYLQSFDLLPSLSPVFDQAAQQKLPSSVSCLIYWRQWTVETLLL